MSTSPAELRAILGVPAGIPADKVDAFFAAIVEGAAAAPPPPAGALDRTRMLLGPDVRASIARSQAKSGRAA